MKKNIILFTLSICLLFFTSAHAQNKPEFLNLNPVQKAWVDSVFLSLTPEERIAQLIMVAATSDTRRALIDTTNSNPSFVAKLIRENKIGGVVFFQGGPMPQARLTNQFQSVSKVPLLVAMDAEWGLAMRIDSTVRYPYQMTMGAMQGHDDLIFTMGAQLAQQARRLGVHINFAPVADINNNPNNPQPQTKSNNSFSMK